MNWVRGVLAALVAALLLAMGSQLANAASVLAHSDLIHGYAYDMHAAAVQLDDTTTERGPPGLPAQVTAPDADSPRPFGSLARPDGRLGPATCADDDTDRLVQTARASRAAEGSDLTELVAPAVLWESGDAAKTADVVVPDVWNAATKLPSGGTVRDVGNRIWGHGLPSADRLAGMTDDELRALASLDDARMLNAMYRGAGPSVPNNATAPVRVDLSQLVIDAWSRK